MVKYRKTVKKYKSKNVKGVTVPNSDGMKGIEVAAVLGIVGGNADKTLEVLSEITEEDIFRTCSANH